MSIADVGCDLDPAGVSENVRKFGDASSQVFAAKCSWRVGRGGRAWQSEAVTTTWNTTVLVEKWEFFEHSCKFWWRTYLSVQKTDVVQNMSKPCWLPTNKLRLLSFPSCRGSFRSRKDLFWARVVKHAIAKNKKEYTQLSCQASHGNLKVWDSESWRSWRVLVWTWPLQVFVHKSRFDGGPDGPHAQAWDVGTREAIMCKKHQNPSKCIKNVNRSRLVGRNW